MVQNISSILSFSICFKFYIPLLINILNSLLFVLKVKNSPPIPLQTAAGSDQF